MKGKGSGQAWGAATILNAVASWKGSAFAVGLRTWAQVDIGGDEVMGDIPGVDASLVVRSAELVLERFGLDAGATVKTWSEIPVASGLKSSSAAANAVVLAALDAIGESMEPLEAISLGVRAAMDVKVTITGAFDDACASFLGGVVVTDNRALKLLRHEDMHSSVVLLVPNERLYSSRTDVTRSRLMADLADLAFEQAMSGDFCRAMTLNGLLYCAALNRPSEPILAALAAGARAASLSGTGPSYAALVDDRSADQVVQAWQGFGGRVIKTEVMNVRAGQFSPSA
ncbi:MAG: Shikimate kinase [Methanosaeta sp. PtaB.Bin039]|nr:MAG: Shikimate kinase [Methanosaeta sp. PtaB.Bin039]HOT07747.1 shikimate kinase [Methanotrichaceae archaeon]HQF16968.1 shikimate kinase [Methanotrichaceae archaeon]HQI91588.1 shikimate kinase [Methanotrichaceae archaeon]HQJ28917.1 shikimate kinase [Methanotrichaceae archaeon]